MLLVGRKNLARRLLFDKSVNGWTVDYMVSGHILDVTEGKDLDKKFDHYTHILINPPPLLFSCRINIMIEVTKLLNQHYYRGK